MQHDILALVARLALETLLAVAQLLEPVSKSNIDNAALIPPPAIA